MADKASKGTSRVVAQSVTVVRDGKRVSPTIGKPYPFTAAELKFLDAANPAATRKAVNESATVAETPPEGGDTGTDDTAPDRNAAPTAKRTPRRGANAAEKKAAEADEEAEDGDAGDDASDGEEEQEEPAAEDEDEDI
jgi:hypothetical protein